MKEIIIDFADDGEVKLETRGFKGKSCKLEAQFIKDLLGQEISSQLTPAYFETETVSTRRHLPLCG